MEENCAEESHGVNSTTAVLEGETENPSINDEIASKKRKLPLDDDSKTNVKKPRAQDKSDNVPGASDEISSSSKDERPIPIYNELAKAVDVFDHVCFYFNDIVRNVYHQSRHEILGNMSVKDVYIQYAMRFQDDGIKSGLMSFCNTIGALETPILNYFAGVNITAEDILHTMGIVALTDPKDVDIFMRIRAHPLYTTEMMYNNVMTRPNTKNELSRTQNLALVLGSSGSGKTFFSLGELAPKFLRNMDKYDKAVTLHIYASTTGAKFDNTAVQIDSEAAAANLSDWIKKTTSEKIKRDIRDKLNMHVCIVFDEAGELSVKSWFENIDFLRSLCEHVKSIAESVSVVVTGTTLTGIHVDSRDDAYVFRMKPLTSPDLVLMLKTRRIFSSSETPEKVADAIFSHPKLGALATNARSAYFLCEAIEDLRQQDKGIIWTFQLDLWATTLVKSVVEGYIGANGLKNLTPTQRRRVAASIFRALQECKMGELTLPTFVALETDKEISVAHALVQSNVEFSTLKRNLIENENFATTVTPAITVVLYTILGIPTTLLPGWKSEEELAALYAVRQLILDRVETFVQETSSDKWESEKMGTKRYEVISTAKAKLDQSLQMIQLIALRTKVPGNKSGNILVPMVGASTVLVNAEMASYADIIAPNMLIQAKRSSPSNKKAIPLCNELDKCGLLKTSVADGDPLLRGLVELWKGNLDAHGDTSKNTEDFPKRLVQTSAAFPENQLFVEPSRDPCMYAVIEGNSITVGETIRPLPPLEASTAITFVFSTNADEIKLKLLGRKVISISEKNLDNDLSINPATFKQDADRLAWANFVSTVRDFVTIKFLLIAR